MLTLSERGDTWHVALHIKHLPCLPERNVAVIQYKQNTKQKKCIVSPGSYQIGDMKSQNSIQKVNTKFKSERFSLRPKKYYVQPLGLTLRPSVN